MTVDVHESRSAIEFQDLVRATHEANCDVLAIAGGDGTVTLALNAMRSNNRPILGILPTGSGNDFAKEIGIATMADAVNAVETGSPQAVDCGVASFGDRRIRYCCVASVGLDTLALELIHRSRWPRSKMLNIVSSLRALWRYEPRAIRVTWEGGSFEGEMMFAAVANTRSYGGGFLVSPQARIADGLLDLCIVRRTGRWRLLTQFPRILRGTHGAMAEVIQAQSSWVRIEGIGQELPVALDGDLPEAMTPLELRCEPSSVNVVTPATWNAGM